MKRGFVTVLALLCLSACASAPLADPLPSPVPTPSVIPSPPDQLSLNPSPHPSPKPEIIFQTAAENDFDGDGTPETVTLYCYAEDDKHIYADISGSINLSEKINLPSAMGIDLVLSIDLDGDGRGELLIVVKTSVFGGWGQKSLTVLTYDGNEIRQFPFEGFTVEDVELLKDTEVQLDGICYVAVHPETGVIEVGQYMWTLMRIDGEEFLVSELTFTKDGFAVLSQRLETLDYVGEFVGRG
jgi:hypothetical protein